MPVKNIIALDIGRVAGTVFYYEKGNEKEKGLMDDPMPQVLVNEANDLGVEYRVFYYFFRGKGTSVHAARDIVLRFDGTASGVY